MEIILLKSISKHMKDKLIRSSLHRIMKGKSCLVNLLAFYSEVTNLLNERRVVDVICFDFSKTFNTVSRNILLGKVMKYRLHECTVG